MDLIRRYRWIIIAAGAVAVVVAFLAFRPDKLFLDDAVDESLTDAFVTDTTVVVDAAPAETPTTTSAGTTTTAPIQTPSTTEPPASEPVIVSQGEFSGVDHSAVGTATVYEQNGKQILRFEDNTNIQNGPDLYIWVLESEDYEGGVPADYIDLGKIKGNVGGQNYELPPEYDPAIHRTVLVWCLRFSTPFAAAPLA